ncbi:hypothetical protein A9Q96_01485 [Rhodobacterales bacterium 52_120_T64]|nr:hypothetical protein A9Q96_01485 [Rhodobacterales bacterium 52_120_T64]
MVGGTDIFSFIVGPNFGLTIDIKGWITLLVAVVVGGFVLWTVFRNRGFQRGKHLEVSEVEVAFGNSKITMMPNDTDRQIAYAIWVELSTRKIGLPIDIENDVIEEVYNSWYVFFGVVRDLAKEIPVSKLRQGDTEKLVELVFTVLNDGLRPHLTAWQAKFRRWYRAESDANPNKTPQEIQRDYPEYHALVDDMLLINANLMKYREEMKKILS